MKKQYIPIKGHSNLGKDPETGAVVKIGTGNLRERKKALRERERNNEERLSRLEDTIGDIYNMLKNMDK